MNERQLNYNTKMKESRSKASIFHADEFVCSKIDRVDNTLPTDNIQLFQKMLSGRAANVNCRTAIARLKRNVGVEH